MNDNCRLIHETSLGHIMDIWNAMVDIADNGVEEIINKTKSTPIRNSSSIAKASSNLTMVFPVLCSRNISIETASMVNKALEKNDVSMIQRLFASWQIASDDVKSLQDYIAKFHGNISTRTASLDDVFRMVDSTDNFDTGGSAKFISSNEAAAVKNDMSNLDFHLPDSINESSLSSFVVHERDVYKGLSNDGKSKVSMMHDKDKFINYKSLGDLKDIGDYRNSGSEYFKNQVLNSEYKKANELMPTLLNVTFNVQVIKDGNVVVIPYENAIAAVKSKLYPISSEDIVNHVSDKIMDKNWITNFFRATTREISFMKDFVLALDKAKIDALSNSDRKRTTDKMWKVLERRAMVSRLKRAMRQPDSASVAAITTLMISQEEVEYLRKYKNVDIEKVSTIINLFESLNLMCVCVVDESLEVAKFIYDEQEPMWETISFTHLEREASDNSYKKVVNLMTKISR